MTSPSLIFRSCFDSPFVALDPFVATSASSGSDCRATALGGGLEADDSLVELSGKVMVEEEGGVGDV